MGVGSGRVKRVVDEVLTTDAETPRSPELRLERAEGDVAVGAPVRPVARERAGELQLAAPRCPPRPEVLRGNEREP